MPFLQEMARAYFLHRLSSPLARSSGYTDRRRVTEDPTPLRWIRDLGFDPSGHRAQQVGVRASDHDREQVVSSLKRHCAEGRLSTDELTSRVEAAYTAVSLAELDGLTADLPGSPVAAEAPSPPRPSFIGPLVHVAAIGAGLLVLVALASLLAPPEVWASLLMLLVPLGALALISILPFALPVVALLLLARAAGRPTALNRAHTRHSLVAVGRRGSAHLWRF